MIGNLSTLFARMPATRWRLMRPYHSGTKGCRPTLRRISLYSFLVMTRAREASDLERKRV